MTDTVNLVDPEKIHLNGVRLMEAHFETSEQYLLKHTPPARTNVQIGQATGLNIDHNVLVVKLEIILKGLDEQDIEVGLHARYLIHFSFIIDNLNDLVQIHDEKSNVDGLLGATVLSIAYSTARGIILERTQGSFFNGAILPVVNISNLMNSTASNPIDPPAKASVK